MKVDFNEVNSGTGINSSPLESMNVRKKLDGESNQKNFRNLLSFTQTVLRFVTPEYNKSDSSWFIAYFFSITCSCNL